MPTPESKLESLATQVTARLATVKSLWARWEPYGIAVGSAILGGFLVHVFKL
jgi:hypothetical protein